MTEFVPWPKIPRLFRDIVITEKIDGTNAAVIIESFSSNDSSLLGHDDIFIDPNDGAAYRVTAQSRNRLISPESDNYGFASWARMNAVGLIQALGEGRHFGEWWGSGIQRGYGLPKSERRFSLFNTTRFVHLQSSFPGDGLPEVPGLGVVPILTTGVFSTEVVQDAVQYLHNQGSQAAPGFMRPEGIVVLHTAANSCFKVMLENDEQPKAARR